MGIDFSQQTGKMITTKGNPTICMHIENIVYMECCGKTTTIFLNDKSRVEDIKPLKMYCAQLNEMGFFRIDRNILINGKYVTKVNFSYESRTVFLDKIKLKVSKRRLNEIKTLFS